MFSARSPKCTKSNQNIVKKQNAELTVQKWHQLSHITCMNLFLGKRLNMEISASEQYIYKGISLWQVHQGFLLPKPRWIRLLGLATTCNKATHFQTKKTCQDILQHKTPPQTYTPTYTKYKHPSHTLCSCILTPTTSAPYPHFSIPSSVDSSPQIFSIALPKLAIWIFSSSKKKPTIWGCWCWEMILATWTF